MAERSSPPELHPLLKTFFPVVDCIADLFGPDCEVVLHDLSRPECSIVKIRNGHVTGRKECDPMTDLGLKMIKDAQQGLLVLGNYYPRGRGGRPLKSNALVIKDSRGRLVGIICINLDISRLQEAQNAFKKVGEIIGELLTAPDAAEAGALAEEHFDKDLGTSLRQAIDKAVGESGKSPDAFSPEDRQKVIAVMEDRGIFFMKNSVHWVAEALGISVPSIYRYLRVVRQNRQG